MARWNEDGFTALVTPHLDRLYRLAYRLTGRRADAEDLFQDVLGKLYDRRKELSSIRDLSPYVGRVMYNQFVDDRRRYARVPLRLVTDEVDVGAMPATEPSPEQSAERDRSRRAVEAALARLSEEHRMVVLLADAEGYRLAEIEALTAVPIGTLKSRLHRARARLREILAEQGTFSAAPSCKSMEGAKSDAL